MRWIVPLVVSVFVTFDDGRETFAQSAGDQALSIAALASRGPAGPTRFELVESAHTGVDFTMFWEPPDDIRPGQGTGSTAAAAGVAIGDYDGDGHPDLFLTRPFGGNRLFRNLGDFRFKDVTASAGLTAELDYEAWGAGPCFVDIDHDGDLDLYVCSHRRANRFYINQGDGTFVDEATRLGLDHNGASITMALADYDLDGDLDAYLVTNWMIPRENVPIKAMAQFRDGRVRAPKDVQEQIDVILLPSGQIRAVKGAELDHFYRNDNGRFVDVTHQVLGNASAEENFFGHAARWFDYDDDGYPDLHVANDFYGPDQLFHNNGDGTLTDVTRRALPHTPWYSMGSDAADVNNDGRMDLLATDMAFSTHHKFHTSRGDQEFQGWFLDNSDPRQHMVNCLYINTGTGRFLEAARMAGISNTDWTWAVKLADLDSDGRVDAYITNGMTRNWFDNDVRMRLSSGADTDYTRDWENHWKHLLPLREKNFAFRNRGDLRFENVAAEWGLGGNLASFGSALGDLDGDGDLDIVTVNFDDQAHIYRNDGNENHLVAIRLRGTRSNRMGIGAVVTVETDAGRQIRDLPSVRGFMSADAPLIHFGLGDSETIDELTVRWPSGIMQQFANVRADQLITVTESGTPADHRQANERGEPMFVPFNNIGRVRHAEQAFDDFATQPLLPQKLSQLGPGIAVADVNGDGRDDAYLAGALGMTGKLLLSSRSGLPLSSGSDGTWLTNRGSEELASLFFDADGDGDHDLYVVNGGVENGADRDALQDRLYLNDGRGKLTAAGGTPLPDMGFSGGTVVVADFDRDGDLDLFVGGRSVPGKFPQSPRSTLLENNGGQFRDVTEQVAPGLARAGMVTGAVWSDADGDGWSDLLVTTQWGPVQLWHNEQGRLVNHTEQADLAGLTGWWNGIAAGDLDHDGDIDYVATNLGLNTQYRASQTEPATLFYGDMDDDGRDDIVDAHYVDGQLRPVRVRSDAVRAMPILGEVWTTHDQYARATLAELYTAEKLNAALRLEATTFESGVFLNDGNGRFEFRPLPRIAQIAPGFGVAIVDVDGDGHQDVFVAQNFYTPQRYTTRMDGGLSQLLLGDGQGGLRPIEPAESGLVVAGDAKGLAVLDFNDDGWPDFLVATNSGPLTSWENRAGRENRVLTIELVGQTGNPTAVGAMVTVELDRGPAQTFELHAGGSYLSQSTNTRFVGLGRDANAERITVRWPDGNESTHNVEPAANTIEIQQPGR